MPPHESFHQHAPLPSKETPVTHIAPPYNERAVKQYLRQRGIEVDEVRREENEKMLIRDLESAQQQESPDAAHIRALRTILFQSFPETHDPRHAADLIETLIKQNDQERAGVERTGEPIESNEESAQLAKAAASLRQLKIGPELDAALEVIEERYKRSVRIAASMPPDGTLARHLQKELALLRTVLRELYFGSLFPGNARIRNYAMRETFQHHAAKRRPASR